MCACAVMVTKGWKIKAEALSCCFQCRGRAVPPCRVVWIFCAFLPLWLQSCLTKPQLSKFHCI